MNRILLFVLNQNDYVHTHTHQEQHCTDHAAVLHMGTACHNSEITAAALKSTDWQGTTTIFFPVVIGWVCKYKLKKAPVTRCFHPKFSLWFQSPF